MENRIITVQINVTRKSLLMLVGVLVMVAGLIVGGVVLAQTPEQPEEDVPLALAEYDDSLYPKLPPRMNYQGVLKDSDGSPIDGTHDLTMTIYKYRRFGLNKGSWTAVYSETQRVQINEGLFNVVIGQVNPLDPGDFGGLYTGRFLVSGGNLELGIKVDRGPELTPRARLLPVPFAFRAEYVNRFPAPHYNSGWVSVAAGSAEEFVHNTGGDPDDYVVDMTCKNELTDIFSAGINNWFLGGENYYNSITSELLQYGALWRKLDSSSIEIYRQSDDYQCRQVRIRIWRID